MSTDFTKFSGPELQLELARVRTSLALDRTLLAWIRTSLTFITFGFTLAKFVGEMARQGHLQVVRMIGMESPKGLGLTMMTLGLVGLLGGAIDYWRTAKSLTSKALPISTWSASFIVAMALAVLTITLMFVLLLETN